MPENRIETDFGRATKLDLSRPEREYEEMMYPVSQVFDYYKWQDEFNDYWSGDGNKAIRLTFRDFKNGVLENFKHYQVPVIALDKSTTKEAVCVVFEKVNTGGKPLDAFELVTAMYAASGHELRKDWYGDDKTPGRRDGSLTRRSAPTTQIVVSCRASPTRIFFKRFASFTRAIDDVRRKEAANKAMSFPAIIGNRQALLNLPLEAYKKYERLVEYGFEKAAKFLLSLPPKSIVSVTCLIESQVVPLAAILADIGDVWEHSAIREKLVRWYWNGVFGELYSSAAETRIAGFIEVPAWLNGGPEPTTVSETIFRADRLKTMKMRLSAAYKGMNVLLMKEGAKDFRSGQNFDDTVFFGRT